MNKVYFSWEDVEKGIHAFTADKREYDYILGVSRGGIIPATLLHKVYNNTELKIVDPFSNVDEFKDKKVLVVDDIYDSGRTIAYFKKELPQADAFVLVTKEDKDSWVVFPWEVVEDKVNGVEQAVVTLIRASGDDPMRSGVLETPHRFAKAWEFWTEGYKHDPKEVMKVFEDPTNDQMVIVRDIQFYSMCEHHLAPFHGKVHIGYVPKGKVLGLSKFVRLTRIFSRRLQIQEKLTREIAQTIMAELDPWGVAVVIEAEHMCMASRGVHTHGSSTITSEMLGMFREQPESRAEFLKLIERKQ